MKKLLFLSAFVVSSIFANDLSYIGEKIEVGIRPFHIVNAMKDSPLKEELKACLSKKSL